MKIFIARDESRDGDFDNDGNLAAYLEKPHFAAGEWWRKSNSDTPDAWMPLPIESFPEIKNGECREAEIVLKGK